MQFFLALFLTAGVVAYQAKPGTSGWMRLAGGALLFPLCFALVVLIMSLPTRGNLGLAISFGLASKLYIICVPIAVACMLFDSACQKNRKPEAGKAESANE